LYYEYEGDLKQDDYEVKELKWFDVDKQYRIYGYFRFYYINIMSITLLFIEGVIDLNVNYNEMLKFAEVKINTSTRMERFLFRNRYSHALRVMEWAERLHKIEGGDLEIIKIACIFHDVGWDENMSHNIVSKNIANDYLGSINYDLTKTEKVLDAIENHCIRDSKKLLGIESYIVMDADILDEVGALSIIWDAMVSTSENEPSYVKAYERIKKYSIGIKERKNKLMTKTGKEYYEERLQFIDKFITEMEFEFFIK